MTSPELILFLIVAFVAFDYVFDRFLSTLNSSWRGKPIPAILQGIYEPEKYARSQAYGHVSDRFDLVTATLSTVVLIVLLAGRWFGYVDGIARHITQQPVLVTLLFFGILALLSDIINIPFQLYNTFVIEAKFGFNKMTLGTFILDKLKSYLLTAIVGGGLLALLTTIYYRFPDTFWLYAWIVVTVFSVFFAMFYTSLFVPLFNKLTPLPEGELRTAIENYCRGVQFPLTNISVLNNSKRSTKSNAYFSGLGPRKTIVLFDTLIEKHTTEELVAILAHETGHYKKRHIQKGLVINILLTGLMLYIFNQIAHYPLLKDVLGMQQNSFQATLLVAGLLFAPFNLVTGLLMHIYSRKNEFEADAYARTTYAGIPLATGLKKLSADNLSNLTPHPAYVFFNYSHPPLAKRLERLEIKS